jgi:hypothetical protein
MVRDAGEIKCCVRLVGAAGDPGSVPDRVTGGGKMAKMNRVGFLKIGNFNLHSHPAFG